MTIYVPSIVEETMSKTWEDIEPEYQALIDTQLTAENMENWLKEWSHLSRLMDEVRSRLGVQHTIDTTDKEAEKQYFSYIENIQPKLNQINEKLTRKFVESGLAPKALQVPLRDMKAHLEIYSEANLPLFTQEQKLGSEYNKIIGAQTVDWDGEELTVIQLGKLLYENDRALREKVWRAITQRQLQDRTAINNLWIKFMDLRGQITHNAGLNSYRDYKWKSRNRHDYTPADSQEFHAAIEQVVVPAMVKLNEKRQKQLGVDSLRPWDFALRVHELSVDAFGRPGLHPFASADEFTRKANNVLDNVDPELGQYFKTMREENLLDLENRKGKAPGGYCTSFDVINRPFIFMNAVGVQTDVRTLLHEAGHAFHVFETANLEYYPLLWAPLEFCEVASMAMELLASPYLGDEYGGYYTAKDAARARIEHLENIIRFWPYMAVVDAFQHWVYENHEMASDPANCDAKWTELWHRYMQGVDWSGLEGQVATGWHNKQHIHRSPFYYIEYGVAQLGAVQVWRNSLADKSQAIQQYRQALSLGAGATLPDLYQAAGAKLAFDAKTLGEAVELIVSTIEDLEAGQAS